MAKNPHELSDRQKELLLSARTQLAAILDGTLNVLPGRSFLWSEVLRLMGEIEKLLGY